MSDIKCSIDSCNKIASPKCIDLRCGGCCTNLDCERHDNRVVDEDTDVYEDSENSEDYGFCSMCNTKYCLDDEIYECDGCNKFFCYNCNIYSQNYVPCEDRGCYYCRRGCCLNNTYEDERYCSDCFVSNEPTCEICGLENEFECWKCDNCEKVYCDSCKDNILIENECGV